MDPERPSGEVESTAVRSTSRDAERGSRIQRRTPSSSGFLVDSSFLPRSKSLRSSYHRPRRSEPDQGGKRGAPELDIAPKKRSRFPWSRQKEQTKDAQSSYAEATVDQDIPKTSRPHQDATAHECQTRATESQVGGLDRDSLQIVNLALNLSESRRRGNNSYPGSNRLSGSRWTSSTDGHSPVPIGSLPNSSPRPRRNLSQTHGDDRINTFNSEGTDLLVNEPSAVLNYLPHSAVSDNFPRGASGSTLARAAKARRHFELFHEYLRLLPSLPPLKPSPVYSNADSSWSPDTLHPSHRVYNPLQSIRNRKVRFRERCPINIEADGWNDVERVHNWVDSVETKYNLRVHSPFECLILPHFQRGQTGALSQEDLEDADAIATSPPSSLRQVSRANSIKTPRPRSDWVIFPDEFLADAAWVEEAQNKTRILDRDGNNLYPNPALLVVNDPHAQDQTRPSQDFTGSEQLSPRVSVSDPHARLSVDSNNISRGRHPYRPTSPHRIGQSSSASARGYGSRRRKFKLRSHSSSRSPSADEGPYRNSLVGHSTQSISPRRRKAPAWNRYDEKRGSMSSIPSADDRYDPLSLAMMESRVANTAMDIGYFPSIASNLSAPSSRSPSPPKRGFTRAIGSRRDQSRRNSPQRKELVHDSSPDAESARKADTVGDIDVVSRLSNVEPSPIPTKVSTATQEDPTKVILLERKESVPHESKLRGIFKGPGKIAGKVGNEVSKMGDFILKKDTLTHSRQSSFANSFPSDESDSDEEEIKIDKRSVPKAILRRFPTFSDDANRSSPRNSDKSLAKNNVPSLSPLASVSVKDDKDDERKLSHLAGSDEPLSRVNDTPDLHKQDNKKKHASYSMIAHGEKAIEFGPELHTIREEIKRGRIKDASVPFSLARPPITGLAQAQPIPPSSSQDRRPTMPAQSRSWSISDRSLSVLIDTGVPGKSEVERTRALLLSSGIKAREITRRAESVRSPPPDFFRRCFDPGEPIPSVPRLYEHDLASQHILKRIEVSHNLFQQSLDCGPKGNFSPLKSQLTMLEELVNGSLNPRVHAAAQEAESLSIRLNTTNTLAVKQLSETLDKGIRKRHRRLRWVRRTGFVMLEWLLVGALWWVWLIVVAFKLLRKLLRGVMSGVRWVLWL